MMKLEDALWPHLEVAAMLEVVGRDLRHSPEATRLQALAWINTLLIHSRNKVSITPPPPPVRGVTADAFL